MTRDRTDTRRIGDARDAIDYADSSMPALAALRADLADEQPLSGEFVIGCTHVTKESAVMLRTLVSLGARVSWAPSNPLTTSDDMVSALHDEGVRVHGGSRMSADMYADALDGAIAAFGSKATLIVDDGGDFIARLVTHHAGVARNLKGGIDKTTTGVERARVLSERGLLTFPVVSVNDAVVKAEFDNTVGTGQSAIDGILRATGMLIAGKTFVVAGFGYVGKGVAYAARGLGARVIVTEVRATAALRALMEGFEVMPMERACAGADVVCTATGMRDIVTGIHFDRLRSGAVLCNIGHFDCEINLSELAGRAESVRTIRPSVVEYALPGNRRIRLLGSGRVVNLAAADGNPSEIMDLTFAALVLALRELSRRSTVMAPGVHPFPADLDEMVARYKLSTLGVATDAWTPEQAAYARAYGVRPLTGNLDGLNRADPAHVSS